MTNLARGRHIEDSRRSTVEQPPYLPDNPYLFKSGFPRAELILFFFSCDSRSVLLVQPTFYPRRNFASSSLLMLTSLPPLRALNRTYKPRIQDLLV